MLSQKVRYLGVGAIMLVLITCVLIVTLSAGGSDSSESMDGSTTPKALQELRIITRQEWQAQPPSDSLTKLELPLKQVIVTHTVTENCHNKTACERHVKFLQEQHIGTNHFSDIAYNFLIGGDGNVYEGRGWEFVGSFLRGQNSKSQGIAFIGNYQVYTPTEEQMDALDALLANGTRNGYLTYDFKLYGARQWRATISPGQHLYERLQLHKHWSDVTN